MKTNYSKIIIAFAILLSGIFSLSCNSEVKTSDAEKAKVYQMTNVRAEAGFPDFKWKQDGKEYSFKEYTKGKVVFLNLWGTWCGPCRREIPSIIEIANELKDKEFIVIGVPLERDPKTATQKVTAYASAKNINYINLIDMEQKLGGLLQIQSVPTTIIFDRNGKVSAAIKGGRSKEAFMVEINKAFSVK